MTRSFRRRIGAAAFVLFLLAPCLASADSITTLEGMNVSGRIVTEDDNQVVLESEYGQLRFLKINLKSITRGGAGASGPPPTGGSAGANPFGGGEAAPAQPAPFGGFGQPLGTPPPPLGGGGNPFGGGDPFGASDPGSSSAFGDPFGGDAGFAASPAAIAPQPTPSPAPTKPRFSTPDRVDAATVPEGSAALLFGLGPEGPASWRQAGSQQWNTVHSDTPLEPGTEIQTRDTPTARLLIGEVSDEVRLPHESQMILNDVTVGSKATSVALGRGAAWIQASERPVDQPFRLTTTELTATTEGALFLADRSVSATRISVASGKVFVKAEGTGVYVTLKSGESAIVTVAGQILGVTSNPVDVDGGWNSWDTTPLSQLLPTLSLQVAVNAANVEWDKEMESYSVKRVGEGEARGPLGELKYQEQLNHFADGFLKLASATGAIPDSASGWSVARYDTGIPGWKGPYVDGPIPPLDPWRQPLVYHSLKSRSGNPFGRVYSIWQDGRDQGGENASVDKVALIMYFNLDRFKAEKNQGN